MEAIYSSGGYSQKWHFGEGLKFDGLLLKYVTHVQIRINMNKAKAFITCLFWLLALGQLPGQSSFPDSEKRFFFITEIGYLSGTGNVNIDNIKDSNDGFGARLKFIAGHRINDHFSAGVGLGLDGYHEPTYNTFPIFMDFRSYLKDTKTTPFAFLDLGYAVGITDKFETGLLTHIGIGQKLYLGFFGKKAYFLPSVGFNLQKIKRERQVIVGGQFPPQLETIEDNITVKSFSINLGVEF